MKLFKINFLILFFISCFVSKASALNGEATTYRITMTLLELCETGSTDSNCLNPVTIGSGVSDEIDIASTTAGAAAASYGNLNKAKIGTTYTYMQITMKRAFTVAGTVTSGSDSCSTIASSTATIAKNGIGAATSVAVAGTYYAGIPEYASHGDEMNSTSAGDGTGTSADAGKVEDDHEYFEWREKLTNSLVLKGGRIPTAKVAFGTTTALGYLEQAGMATDCTEAAAANQGFYAAAPDVSVTFE